MNGFALENLHSISNVEVFRDGEWNGMTFTKKDIMQIVKSFQETKTAVKPFLKLGHNDEQGVLAADDIPAAGWVSDLRMEKRLKGKDISYVIVADFQGIPEKVYSLMENGVFRGRSIEIWRDVKVGGKNHPWLLTAVAILGANLPAVNDLEDMMSLFKNNKELFAGKTVHTFDTEGEPFVFKSEDKQNNTKEQDMELKEALEALGAEKEKNEGLTKDLGVIREELKASSIKGDDFEAQVESLTGELEVSKTEKEEAVAEADKFKAEKHEAEIDGELDKLVREKKITPAQKPLLKTVLSASKGSDSLKFKVGENEDASLKDAILAFVGEGSSVSLNDEEASLNETPDKEENEVGTIGTKLANAAKKYKSEQKALGVEVTIGDAMIHVADGNQPVDDEEEESE